MPDLLTKGVWAIAAVMILILLWLVAKAVFPFAVGVFAGAGLMWYFKK